MPKIPKYIEEVNVGKMGIKKKHTHMAVYEFQTKHFSSSSSCYTARENKENGLWQKKVGKFKHP